MRRNHVLPSGSSRPHLTVGQHARSAGALFSRALPASVDLSPSPIAPTTSPRRTLCPPRHPRIRARHEPQRELGSLTSNDSRVNKLSAAAALLQSPISKRGVLSNKEDGLKGTAVDDLRRLAGSAQCTLPHNKVFGLLGLLPQAISSKITIDCKRDETELSSEFTAAISIANENSGNLEGAGDVKIQSATVNSIYALQDVPGRGKGLVAMEKISKGTRILSEEAVVTVSEAVSSERLRASICQQVEAVSAPYRQSRARKATGDWRRFTAWMVRLYNEQGREDVGFAQAFVNAAQLAIANSDLARRRIFAERAVSVWKTTLGGDSTQAIKHGALAQDPSKYELFGISMNDFEDWLWRREKPKALGQLANLRSRATFPGFNDLPDENDVDPDFYESSDMVTYRPRRHWCFLGEIVDFTTLHHLEIETKDVDSGKIPLHFYTDGRGSELAPAQVRSGYTVAILYAKRHVFKFGDPGIRHEDPRMIKVFPLSLDKLLALNDQACQVVGWNEKGHKADCKLLKDPDLRGLFILKWDEFDNHIRFPLYAAKDF
ncbi:MAG: hypothetical protein M1813_004118 [Trichoglossum hirsutum]|nr:MAG: hypothetical protein M1813_004118 [Trichoglossum hirsutum]